ncbi:MAG: septal ring lytic transglycosylase RlpA family protein [Burkholderiaceae bacterium]|nr:septal ring lytic transglycosylase RlpA family protein [Burkholderiaceae bacterium]
MRDADVRAERPQVRADVRRRARRCHTWRDICQAAVAAALFLLAACASAPKHPGFYQEDGPPDRVPPDLLATPDAVPRDEPLSPNANRPYVALGRTYVPDISGKPFRQRGIASWYGRQFQGNRTASGEPYNMFAMTAAHPTLPIPTYARVTNLRDGRSVIVRINDRGPFVRDRIIDLSYAAAARLGLAGPGSGEVEVDRILPSQIAQGAPAAAPPQASPQPPSQMPSAPPPEAPVALSLAVAPPVPEPPAAVLPAPQPPPAQADTPVAQPGARWSVQLGAFRVDANAQALRDRLALLLSQPDAASVPAELRVPRIERQADLTRVLIGDTAQRAVALEWSRLLQRYLGRQTALFVR